MPSGGHPYPAPHRPPLVAPHGACMCAMYVLVCVRACTCMRACRVVRDCACANIYMYSCARTCLLVCMCLCMGLAGNDQPQGNQPNHQAGN